MNANEIECLSDLRAFAQFGGYALQRLPLVIDNIWEHYEIKEEEKREQIMKAAGLFYVRQ